MGFLSVTIATTARRTNNYFIATNNLSDHIKSYLYTRIFSKEPREGMEEVLAINTKNVYFQNNTEVLSKRIFTAR